jgi:hypothetical protein
MKKSKEFRNSSHHFVALHLKTSDPTNQCDTVHREFKRNSLELWDGTMEYDVFLAQSISEERCRLEP